MTAPDEEFPLPLKVSVVGAGIGGLSAAIALRKNGHIVKVFETSEIKTEVGAGIAIQFNAMRVFDHWGLSKDNLKGINFDGLTVLDSKTGEGISRRWSVPDIEIQSLLCHRSDVHNELMRLAVGAGDGPPVQLHLGSRVLECDFENGTVTLENGDTIHADLVIGADGLHSVIRTSILGDAQTASASGISCFRSVFDASKVQGDFGWFTEGISGARNVVVKEGEYRLLFTYPCRSGQLINLVAIYTDPHQDDPGWVATGTREELLEKFHDVHPKFLAFLALADSHIVKWQLRVLPVLPTWVRGRAALLGDAAHATLPTLGQGAGLAIEEAGALGCLLPLGTRREEVPSRLEAYQTLRKPRGDYVSRESVHQGSETFKQGRYYEVQTQLLQHDAIGDAKAYYAENFSSSH
ncbi:FAD/NAD(P)-binding domain-containing protein [Mycena rosella]|uniref:FAD/NAD(P)-binding domain-containing protein n=1 Tax=Mycena rosella TaxID=1033263 RepID=A0AAD7D812_MYCRO|nr:FAD/NAD(P)-binding domain-containing protein [Mycena rosella]